MNWSKLFSFKDLKSCFLEFSPKNSQWTTVSWNFDLSSATERKWVIETIGSESWFVEWIKTSRDQVSFYFNKKLLSKKNPSKNRAEILDMMNLSIHSTLKNALRGFEDFMLTPVSGATALDIQNEARALQWIQTSFGLLTRSLNSLTQDKQLILTCAFFCGSMPGSDQKVVRLIIFNLDIFYYLHPDQTLEVVVFDDKDLGHGESKEPTYRQIIKVTKPQFYDEIIKLVHKAASVGEVF